MKNKNVPINDLPNQLVPIEDLPNQLVPIEDLPDNIVPTDDIPAIQQRPQLQGGVEQNVLADIAKSGISGLTQIPAQLSKPVETGLQELNEATGKKFTPEQLNQILSTFRPERYEPQTFAGEVAGTAGEIAPYLAMPQSKTISSALTGGLSGGVEASKQGKTPSNIALSALLGAGAGAGIHGAGKGYEKFVEPAIGQAALFLSGIRKPLAETATEKGSKVLDFVKQIEAGLPEEEVQKIFEQIREPLNKDITSTTKQLTNKVYTAKKNLVENYKEKIPFEFPEIKETIQNIKSDRHFEGSPLLNRLSGYIKELEEGTTPERALKLRDYINDYVINYKKESGDLAPFENIIQSAAKDARLTIKNKLADLSPELKEANKQFTEFKELKGALPESLSGLKETGEKFEQKLGQKSAQQINTLKAALKSPAHQVTRQLIEKLPSGKETLKQGKYLDVASQLANLDISGKRIPLGKLGIIMTALTAIPRKVALESTLPKMLAKNEGRIIPKNQMQQTISKLSKLAISKGASYLTPDGEIPAQNIRAERNIR